MSANAPAGSVNRKKGSDPTVEISEIRKLEWLSSLIIQVAAVSCADTQQPEIKLIIHSLLKTGFCSARKIEVFLIANILLLSLLSTISSGPLVVRTSLSQFPGPTNRYLNPWDSDQAN